MPSDPASGPKDSLDYEVIVSVPGAERAIQFWIGGMPRLPRIGEKLDFDGPENDNLALLVTDVRHGFSVRDDPVVRVYAVLDQEGGEVGDLYLAQRLLEGPELERWTSQFTMLSADDSVAFRVGMRAAADREAR
ncbi:hypothetical protein [Nocardia sp. NPDC020380]|uniref:hypothetical protein n=1 Tax=Nocardia sp. NPDC020380 TaxID=3364309 RepID=UPI0037BDF01C